MAHRPSSPLVRRDPNPGRHRSRRHRADVFGKLIEILQPPVRSLARVVLRVASLTPGVEGQEFLQCALPDFFRHCWQGTLRGRLGRVGSSSFIVSDYEERDVRREVRLFGRGPRACKLLHKVRQVERHRNPPGLGGGRRLTAPPAPARVSSAGGVRTGSAPTLTVRFRVRIAIVGEGQDKRFFPAGVRQEGQLFFRHCQNSSGIGGS